MKHTINLADKAHCSGCAACMNICPMGAITMQADREGFLYPSISEDKCVGCMKCQKVCPVLVPVKSNDLEQSECYAVWAIDDIRRISSSGGMFSLLAEHILEQNGVVYGVAFDKEWNVSHIRVDNLEDLSKLRGSKYVQSNIGYIFRQVKQDMEENRKILFSGSPCQIAGLYNYIGMQNENLLTVDLLCHGVPSAKVFQKYLKDSFGDKQIIDIRFRDKKIYKWSSSMHIAFADGSQYDASCREDSFYKGFLPCLILRPSCEKCSWSSVGRIADISIGDFWGIHTYSQECDDGKGTSSVLINTELGKKYFLEVQIRMVLKKQMSLKELIPGNSTLVRPFQAHTGRKHFFNDIDVLPMKKLVEHSLEHKYDVGIVGLWYGLNYGSILTYYALYKVVNQLGYDAIFVTKPDSLWTEKYNDPNSIASKFIYARCNVTNRKTSAREWHNLNDNCDMFMVGSDVIWNYEICGKESGEFFFLDFVKDSKKKIAYASSFGSGYIAPDSVRLKVGHYLKKFDAVSVRETEAQVLCKEKFGVKADKVLDAVFLCGRQMFIDLAEQSEVRETAPFISAYILGSNLMKRDVILKIADMLKVSHKIFVDPNEWELGKRCLDLDTVERTAVEDWLYYIKNCKFFVADSFHGLCFSIIFKVPFVCIIDREEPSKCRFLNLLELCGLSDRLIYTDECVDDKIDSLLQPIDYDKVYERLEPYITYSRGWLAVALKAEKLQKYTVEDRIQELFVDLMQETDWMKQKIQRLSTEMVALKKNMFRLSRGYDATLAVTDTIDAYLNHILQKKNKLFVLIAVRDTAGFFIDDAIYEIMQKIGFQADLRDKHWYGYVGLCGMGQHAEVLEQCGVAILEQVIQSRKIELLSQSYNNGDMAQIRVDGVDYAINHRGLNIVCISAQDFSVIDSVCFDTHTEEKRCYRYGEGELKNEDIRISI